MDKPWLSAEVEAASAKADSLQHAIDAISTVAEILTTHEGTQHVRQTMHLLSVERDHYNDIASRADREQGKPVKLVANQS